MEDKQREVAISYAWTSEKHKREVREFAEQLTRDNIYVHFDQWDFKKGNSLSKNMEDLLKSDEIDNILIICDELYAQKANDREGGVGKETLIISPEVYKNADQDKVIPIIWERDDDGNAFLPIYLEDRDYIDLSDDEYFEEQYQELVMQIYGKSKHERPPLGKTPSYVFDDTPAFKTSTFSLRRFSSSLNSTNMDMICIEFLEKFLNDLKSISLNIETHDYKDTSAQFISYLDKYDSIRDLFIKFLDKITKNEEVESIVDSIIDFFVELEYLSSGLNFNTKRADKIFYSFILMELFLYTVTMGLKNKKYSFVRRVIHTPYYFKEYENEPKFFVKFSFNRDLINVLDYHINELHGKNKLSPIGEMLISRLHPNIKNDSFVDADLICFYVTLLYYEYFKDVWVPYTYPYKQEEYVDLIRKLSKKSHFDKVKCIFEVNTINEMKELFDKASYEQYKQYRLGTELYYPLPIYESINYENIGKYTY